MMPEPGTSSFIVLADYEPAYYENLDGLDSACGERLDALVGQVLEGVYVVFDAAEETWNLSAPCVLRFSATDVVVESHSGKSMSVEAGRAPLDVPLLMVAPGLPENDEFNALFDRSWRRYGPVSAAFGRTVERVYWRADDLLHPLALGLRLEGGHHLRIGDDGDTTVSRSWGFASAPRSCQTMPLSVSSAPELHFHRITSNSCNIILISIILIRLILWSLMFVGRERELAQLEELYATGTFQMVVVYGRRRVGKTSLVTRFGADKRTLYYTALEQSDADNLSDFSRRIYEFFGLPLTQGGFSSWRDALTYLAGRAAKERFVLIFDEFPYAASRNESLPSVLQVTIDHRLKATGLFLILCGSNQGFMESQVLGERSPLFGRRTSQIRLGQLDYLDAAKMLPSLSPQDQFRFWGCFGGVPYYLEQVKAEKDLRQNLATLYFSPTGFLYGEPMGLLRQELSEPALYSSILRAVAAGANRPSLISDRTRIPQTTLPKYLRTLADLGILERAAPFGENSQSSKRAIYRVADACYDFWFRFVMPRTSDVEQGLGPVIARHLPEEQLGDYLGHRFERACAEWLRRQALADTLPIAVTSVGSWWGTNPATRRQDDIDVLAADREAKRLLIGECKYRESFDETAEIDDLDAKRDLIKDYHASHVALFSKWPVSAATQAKLVTREDVLLVTLEDLYARG